MSNLLTILSALTGGDIPSLVEQFRGHGYGELKAAVADEVIAFVTPFRANLAAAGGADGVGVDLAAGAERAREVASRTLVDAYRKVGLLPGRLASPAERTSGLRAGWHARTNRSDERYVRA